MKQTPRHRERRTGGRRLVLVGLLLLLVALATVAKPNFSSATFTSRTSAGTSSVTAASDWTPPTVAVQAPAAFVRGTVTVTMTATDADSGVKDVVLSGRPTGGTWSTLCTDSTAPYSCSIDTTGLANGTYELRAVATDKAANTATSAVVTTVVDNAAPTVSLTDPGSPLGGTRTFAVASSDAHSGVASVAVQASANGTTWTTLCTATASPYSCSYDTKQLADGSYSFRAQSTDRAGNTATSAVITNRVVDNSVATVTLTDPGAYLFGTVTVNATAQASAGIKNVVIQRSPAGANTWTTICTDTTAPYSCSWNTTGVADGLYDLRAVLTDNANKTATSTVVANRRVDNASPFALDVQAANGGTAGVMDAGDTITLTYSAPVNPSSISAGWSGTSALPIRLGISYSLLRTDVVVFGRSDGSALNVGQIELNDRYASFLSDNVFDATLTSRTVTIDGAPRTVLTITLGQSLQGSQRGNGSTATMVWTPSTAASGVNGRAVSSASAVETGASDLDF